jgi:short-subunit dehydrogenase
VSADRGSKRLAVVTGASSGIGAELARVFAENGFDLVICAEDTELDDAERMLKSQGVGVEAVRADLAEASGVEQLYARIQATGRPVDALALNAGIGAGGQFAGGSQGHESDLAKELRLVDLNCRSTVHLAKLVVRDMVKRSAGRVLITSSVAATMPGPFQAVYNASKSFDQSFALALRDELKDTGVTVTTLIPGPTETEFFERADMEDTPVAKAEKDDPAQVAEQGFEALMSGEERVVAGSLENKAQVLAGRLIPDSVKARMHRKKTEPEEDG